MSNVKFDAANYYYSGQGVVMIGQRDPVTGNPLGLRPVGNVTDLKIAIATTVVNHKGSQDGQRAVDARLQTETNATASMTIDNWSSKNLADALRGGSTAIVGGTMTGVTVTGYPGLVTGLPHIKVSAVVVKQGSTTLTDYVNDQTTWDYKLNADAGSILLNDGTGPAAVAGLTGPGPITLTVSYTYATQTLVDSLTLPLTESWLRFEGLNTVDGNAPVVVDVFRFSNDPLRELALISDAFGQFVLEGTVLKDFTRPSGMSSYFQVRKTH
jgi:hypothetical protein